ncbi:hypothetical protein CK203_088041 [Vitis vinifera]|uniref:Uncharacterized protein n=1 Tax=Vitis vinifera TaxID=29760 RepID=A0A438DBT3_VITVI|nr:hypothetical protein CK203_088041 [Vitis vinifera]
MQIAKFECRTIVKADIIEFSDSSWRKFGWFEISRCRPTPGFPLWNSRGSILFAYDSIQKILAIATRDGRIKLFGKDNTQALLESNETVPSKFLQFIENQGILLNVTAENHIEASILETLLIPIQLCLIVMLFVVTMLHEFFYTFHIDPHSLINHLPLGNPTEVAGGTAVMHILPQPTAESKR